MRAEERKTSRYEVVYLLIAIISLIAIYFISDYPARAEAYNAHMCATYGYEPDCDTPLADNDPRRPYNQVTKRQIID